MKHTTPMTNKTPFMRILYDGDCPLCIRKIRFLQRRDHHGKLSFSDIRAKDFQSLETGLAMDVLEKQIHAILPDGQIISRMEVIRAAYREIGLGWLIAPTGWPVLKLVFDFLYGRVAKHRLRLSRFVLNSDKK